MSRTFRDVPEKAVASSSCLIHWNVVAPIETRVAAGIIREEITRPAGEGARPASVMGR